MIPKDYRDELDINQDTPVSIELKPGMMLVIPISGYYSKPAHTQTYTEILKETQGAWGSETRQEKLDNKKRKELELKATTQMKKAW